MNYADSDILEARHKEEQGLFTLSGETRRCTRCRIQVELLVSELPLSTETTPAEYLCADCDAGLYPDPREPRS